MLESPFQSRSPICESNTNLPWESVQEPWPGLQLSTGALLALADLQTIAQRTVLKGGSSWGDAWVLAPGLHYQQAANSIGISESESEAVESLPDGSDVKKWIVQNLATRHFLQRVAGDKFFKENLETEDTDDEESDAETRRATGFRKSASTVITEQTSNRRPRRNSSNSGSSAALSKKRPREKNMIIDIGPLQKMRDCRKPPGSEAQDVKKRESFRITVLGMLHEAQTMWESIDWASHLLYLASPLLTVGAVVAMILFADSWFGLGAILSLMLARVINIGIIKARVVRTPEEKPKQSFPQTTNDASIIPQSAVSADPKPTQYTVALSPTSKITLRGLPADLQAVTTSSFMRPLTPLQGYLEATAKLIVYMVAALSGNITQAGQIVLMGLLVSSAALLAVSNAKVKDLSVNGRVGKLALDQGKDGKRVEVKLMPKGQGDAEISTATEWAESLEHAENGRGRS